MWSTTIPARGISWGRPFRFAGSTTPATIGPIRTARGFMPTLPGAGTRWTCGIRGARQLVLDSLRYWVSEMHVDGFRFDIAPVLAAGRQRLQHGSASSSNGFARIRSCLRSKLIAEPWDLGPDGYQAGTFPAGWSEWNDKYRDTVRQFWRGDAGTGGAARVPPLRAAATSTKRAAARRRPA